MKSFTPFLFLLLIACDNNQKKLYSTDFMDTSQSAFNDSSMHFYRIVDSAANNLGKRLAKQEQKEWMNNYFSGKKIIHNWVGEFTLDDTDTGSAIFSVEFWPRVVFKGIASPANKSLYQHISRIPDSSQVQISGTAYGVIEYKYFDLPNDTNLALGIPDVGIFLDSIRVLPVKH